MVTQYRPEIDGLRALAVIPVIFFHAGIELFSGGFVGVDIFFVISGYLISTIIMSQLGSNTFNLKEFYIRRARRILPALFFIMVICLPFSFLLLAPSKLLEFGRSLTAVSIFSSNFLFWSESGYFGNDAELKPLLHTWSLAVEEQFYIFFPIFLAVFWRFGLKIIITLIILISIVSLLLAYWATLADYEKIVSGAFFLLPTRVWELFVGSLTAIYMKFYHVEFNRLYNQYLSLAGIFLILLSIFYFNEDTPFPSFYTLVPVIGTALIIVSAKKNTIIFKILSSKLFVSIGLISYSAYLWHQPVLAYAKNIFVDSISITLTLSLCFFSLIAAWFSWRFVERPFRNKNEVSSVKMVKISLFGILFFAILGTYINYKDGYFPIIHQKNILIKEGNIGHDLFHNYLKENYFSCKDKLILNNSEVWNGIKRCRQSGLGVPEVALLGDSHAEHLFIGIADSSKKNITYLVKNGDAFLNTNTHNYLFEYLADNEEIKTVIYSIYWWKKYERLGEDAFKIKINEILSFLKKSNKNIILVSDVPDFINDAEDCLLHRKLDKSKGNCSIGVDKITAQKSYLKVLKELAHKFDVQIIDPSPLFCNLNGCTMHNDGYLYFRDNDHLNIQGSVMVGKYITDNSKLL